MKRILAMFLLAFSLSAFAGEEKAPAGEKAAAGDKSDKSKKHGKKMEKKGAEGGEKKADTEKKP
jgi:hypothetical protein